jgi:thiamine-monophosphate kinase
MDDSEFDVIEQYFLPLGEWSLGDTRVGPGDDCAVVQVPDSRQLCISTDSFIEGVHFPTGANGQLVARRSMAAAISDLAAMGATPFGMTGALTLVAVSAPWLKQFSSVVADLIKRWQIPLLGGNLSRGSELSVTWTVMGLVEPGRYYVLVHRQMMIFISVVIPVVPVMPWLVYYRVEKSLPTWRSTIATPHPGWN